MPDRSVVGGTLLAFIGFFPVKRGGRIGAAMVTDEYGYPQEFRASIPVRPNLIQKVLYGVVLESYLVEVIGPLLLDALENHADLVIVNHRETLDFLDPAAPACMAPASENPADDGRFEVRHLEFGGRTVAVETQGEFFPELLHAVRRVDPAEVFTRMQTALKVLAMQDDRYK